MLSSFEVAVWFAKIIPTLEVEEHLNSHNTTTQTGSEHSWAFNIWPEANQLASVPCTICRIGTRIAIYLIWIVAK